MTDTGVGIDPTELPHIFERFYRGSRANEARGSGSGLGLAIVRSIVDMHGGTVEVESRVGQGTRFVVTLPRDPRLVEGTPAAEQAAVASAADARRPRRTGSSPAAVRPGAGGLPASSEAQIANVQETSPYERSQDQPAARTIGRDTPSVAHRPTLLGDLPASCTTNPATPHCSRPRRTGDPGDPGDLTERHPTIPADQNAAVTDDRPAAATPAAPDPARALGASMARPGRRPPLSSRTAPRPQPLHPEPRAARRVGPLVEREPAGHPGALVRAGPGDPIDRRRS